MRMDGVALTGIEKFLSCAYPQSVEFVTSFSIDQRQLSINAAMGKTKAERFIQKLLKEQFEKAQRYKRMRQTKRHLLRKPVSVRREVR